MRTSMHIVAQRFSEPENGLASLKGGILSDEVRRRDSMFQA